MSHIRAVRHNRSIRQTSSPQSFVTRAICPLYSGFLSSPLFFAKKKNKTNSFDCLKRVLAL